MGAILDLPEMRERVRRWTVVEYAKLEDHPAFRQCELIRGIILDRPPHPPLQSFLTGRIYSWLRAATGEEGMSVWQHRPLELTDSVPEPDIAVVRGTKDDFRTQHPTTAELVVEVAVDSLTLDREKASLYAEASVAEYWIVLGATERVEVYRRPVEGVYQEQRTYVRGEVIAGVNVTAQDVPVDALFA